MLLLLLSLWVMLLLLVFLLFFAFCLFGVEDWAVCVCVFRGVRSTFVVSSLLS